MLARDLRCPLWPSSFQSKHSITRRSGISATFLKPFSSRCFSNLATTSSSLRNFLAKFLSWIPLTNPLIWHSTWLRSVNSSAPSNRVVTMTEQPLSKLPSQMLRTGEHSAQKYSSKPSKTKRTFSWFHWMYSYKLSTEIMPSAGNSLAAVKISGRVCNSHTSRSLIKSTSSNFLRISFAWCSQSKTTLLANVVFPMPGGPNTNIRFGSS